MSQKTVTDIAVGGAFASLPWWAHALNEWSMLVASVGGAALVLVKLWDWWASKRKAG